jgi:hypothetical protein
MLLRVPADTLIAAARGWPTPFGRVFIRLDRRLPLADMATQSRRIDQTILQERTSAQLCACFGGLLC